MAHSGPYLSKSDPQEARVFPYLQDFPPPVLAVVASFPVPMAEFILAIGTPDLIFPYRILPPTRARMQERVGPDGVLLERALLCNVLDGPFLSILPVAPGALEASLYFNGKLWLERVVLEAVNTRMFTFQRGLFVTVANTRVPASFLLVNPPEEYWNELKAAIET